MQETQVQSLVEKIQWRREWLLTAVFLPGEIHGQRNLAGYSPWGRKESDTIEQLTTTTNSHLFFPQMKARIEARSEAKISGLLWAGLAMLSVQGGAMAWLTWWVYSWDIMEPVTYFITFANSMV